MRVFLSGPMGSGKTTVLRAVAQRLGVPGLDLDEQVVARSGKTIPQLFEEGGEQVFREQEAQALNALLDRQGESFVLALGGGTVTQPPLRQRLLREGVLITLEASVGALVLRLQSEQGRPLLDGSTSGEALRQRVQALLAERGPAYAECHATVRTDQASVDAVAAEVVAVAEQPPIVVPLAKRTYQVQVGAGIRDRLATVLKAPSTVVLVTDDTVAPLWLKEFQDVLTALDLRHTTVILPAGEANKHSGSVQKIWDAALDFGIDRKACVLGLGGGVVGDMAGFAAATLLRGIAVGHVPTTLLSMVDSAIGGKTGFDTKVGKNLVGAFHQPRFVLADTDTLRTLPEQEYLAGFAEVVKSAWIESEGAVAQLEQDVPGLLAREPEALARTVRMCCHMKARVVTEDEREAGLRAVLNLGHTVGHAIEAAQGYGAMRHGEAIALGMAAACRLAQRLGVQRPEEGARLLRLLQAFKLDTHVDPHLTDTNLAYMGADKKRDGQDVTFVVPGAPGAVTLRKMALVEVLAAVRP